MERSTGQFIPSEPYIPFDPSLVDGSRGDSNGAPEQRFTQFSEVLGRDLAPRSLLEHVLADHVILAAWTLRTIAEREHDAIRNPHGLGVARGDGSGQVDVSPRDVLDVADCLGKTLELFHRLRGAAPVPASPPAPRATDVTSDFDFDSDTGPDSVTVFDLESELDGDQLADLSNEWPIVPRGRSVEDHPDGDTGYWYQSDGGEESLAERWRGRLCFDRNVSEDSPVIKGTWVTVSQVVSLIVDGWTWSDILRTHPELSEDDIRTCLAYTVAEEDGEL